MGVEPLDWSTSGPQDFLDHFTLNGGDRYYDENDWTPPTETNYTAAFSSNSSHEIETGFETIPDNTPVEGDVKAQIDETLMNLATLVAAGDGSSISSEPSEIERQSFLKKFEHVRIYHRRREDAQVVENHLASEFPGAKTIEISTADLCRPPLLVEVEGTAEL